MAARVLVVDDDPWILRMVSSTLEKRGFIAETAKDGQAALEKARNAPPDVIVTDLMMPVMDGWELVRQLRTIPHLAAIPVIFLTALGRDEAQLRSMGLGPDDYLAKPFRFADLEKRVAGALAKAQAGSGVGRPPGPVHESGIGQVPPGQYPSPGSYVGPVPGYPTHESQVGPLPGYPPGYPPHQGYPPGYPPHQGYPPGYPPPQGYPGYPPYPHTGQGYPPNHQPYGPPQNTEPPQAPTGKGPPGVSIDPDDSGAINRSQPPSMSGRTVDGVRVPRRSTALNGRLEQLGLSSLLVMMEMERKDGVLTLKDTKSEAAGRIFLRGGQVVCAKLDAEPNTEGRGCVYAMLTWRSGTFSFNAMEVDMEDTVQSSTTHLLMEGARLIDESNRDGGL